MPGRRILALLAAGAVAAGAGSAALAAPGFDGTARSIAPTVKEIHFKALAQSTPSAKPPADKRRGFRSGWQAAYLKGTAASPIQALVLVYVYRTTADARRAYARSCSACDDEVAPGGIRMKFQLRSANGTPTVIDIATCRNVYAAIVVAGKKKANALAQDAGALAGAVYRKAIARGMSPCAKG